MNVLITRPLEAGKGLCEKINQQGMHAKPFPVIECHATPNQTALALAIDALETIDIVIFVSRPAVQFTLPAIKKRWCLLPSLIWAAIGPATAEALKAQGIPKVLLPLTPPYETESLLAIKALKHIDKKKILIFRGNSGRDLLRHVLEKRGGIVHTVESYQRCLPNMDKVERLANWHHNAIDVIVTTSAAGLHNLLLLIPSSITYLKEIPLVVVGTRMLQLANKLGFKHPLLAADADDTSIIKVLTEFKDKFR